MKYKVCIEEMISEEFEIEADSVQNAMSLAEQKYSSGELVLAPGNLVAKQMAIVEPKESVTEWSEF